MVILIQRFLSRSRCWMLFDYLLLSSSGQQRVGAGGSMRILWQSVGHGGLVVGR